MLLTFAALFIAEGECQWRIIGTVSMTDACGQYRNRHRSSATCTLIEYMCMTVTCFKANGQLARMYAAGGKVSSCIALTWMSAEQSVSIRTCARALIVRTPSYSIV